MSSYVGIVVNKMQVTEVWLISIHIVSGNGLSPNTMGGNLCFQLEYALSKLEPRLEYALSKLEPRVIQEIQTNIVCKMHILFS